MPFLIRRSVTSDPSALWIVSLRLRFGIPIGRGTTQLNANSTWCMWQYSAIFRVSDLAGPVDGSTTLDPLVNMNPAVTIRLSDLVTSHEHVTDVNRAAASQAPQAVPLDETLMALIREGDSEALAILFRRYARVVRGVAYRVLRDSSEADDLLQDIFLLIHRKCGTFDASKGSARSWILQMTYRRAISRRRYLDCRHFYTRIDLDDMVNTLPSDGANNKRYEDSIEGVLGNGTLEKLFQSFSENQRQTFRLFFMEGYSLDEIALQLGQSRGNVQHHYFRGLEKLRKQIFGRKSPSE
jgi:RNA polymerase sigma-70 factor, ECF subfamily